MFEIATSPNQKQGRWLIVLHTILKTPQQPKDKFLSLRLKNAINNNRPLKVFNKGKHSRDFTYIDDIVSGVVNTLLADAKDSALYKLYNIGNSVPVELMDFIQAIESKLGVEAQKQMLPMQPGDVNQIWADVRALQKDYNYRPNTSVEDGVAAFVDWYQSYYKTNEGVQIN